MTPPSRQISLTYRDPLDLIWIETARKLGIEIERDENVFAAWDGRGVLRIGTPETLDPDDSLAQMIFHELCHALIEGPEAFGMEDWGLNNDFDSRTAGGSMSNVTVDEIREHACLRLQAALADQYELRKFFATTTDFRAYYDRLPSDPLAVDDDPALEVARAGWARAKHGSWSVSLDLALEMTSSIRNIVRAAAPETSLWSK